MLQGYEKKVRSKRLGTASIINHKDSVTELIICNEHKKFILMPFHEQTLLERHFSSEEERLTVALKNNEKNLKKNERFDRAKRLITDCERKGHRMEHEEEWILIKRAMTGDQDAFAQLFERHYSFLFKYLLKLTLDEEVSADLAQDTMIKCYTNLSSFKGEGKFSTWMISISTRLYMDFLRKQKREKMWLNQLKRTLSRQFAWQAHARGMEWSDAFADFNQLADEVRVPILLHHYYGYSYDEVGQIMGIRPGTVKSRVHNGLIQLRKE